MRSARHAPPPLPPATVAIARGCVAALAFVVVTAASAGAHAQKSPTAQAALDRAYHHLVANHFAQAATEMETAVRFEPRFAYGWYLLASTSRRAGEADRAAGAYRRYAELRPADPDPYFGLGLSLDAVGDRAGALAALRKYIESDHRPASTSFVEQARKRVEALEREGAARPPATGDGKPAAALLAERKFAEAAEVLRRSIALAPADAGAWYKLGFALRQAGQPVEAAKAYRRSITLQPGDPDAYYGLGQVLVAANRPDEAVAAFRTYVKAGTNKGDARWISKARQEIARLDAAARAARSAPATPPSPLSSAAQSGSASVGSGASLASAHQASEPTPSTPKTAP